MDAPTSPSANLSVSEAVPRIPQGIARATGPLIDPGGRESVKGILDRELFERPGLVAEPGVRLGGG